MSSSDNILNNPWAKSGGEKVSGWEKNGTIADEIESGRKPDTNISPWDNAKSDF
jgi:hypothetical protein